MYGAESFGQSHLAVGRSDKSSQGFSGKNRFKDAEDMRNEEVIVVIAEVERSRPDWVVIENVLGMAHGRSDGALLAEGSMSSFADFVNKMLIGLG